MRKYRVTIEYESPFGIPFNVLDEDGQAVSFRTARWLIKAIDNVYPEMGWLYIGESYSKPGVFKVGISQNVERRAGELFIDIQHIIPGRWRPLQTTERRLHKLLREAGVHEHGEWFRLHPPGFDWLVALKSVPDELKLRFWIPDMHETKPWMTGGG